MHGFLIPRKEGGGAGLSKFTMKQVASFDEHNAQVWRLAWNVTGTILASSGDDGCVRMWKGRYCLKFKLITACHS